MSSTSTQKTKEKHVEGWKRQTWPSPKTTQMRHKWKGSYKYRTLPGKVKGLCPTSVILTLGAGTVKTRSKMSSF